jgi:phospholipid transport system substrate-binding protein
MTRWLFAALAAWILALTSVAPARAQGDLPPEPDRLIEALTNRILERIKSEPELRSGDLRRLSQFADETVMPYVNFERMTALAVGRGWRTATPEQQQQLMTEFRAMLLRTYAGALSSVRDQTIRVKPLRAAPGDTEVIVRSEIVGTRGDPIQIDYRMERSNPHWRIYDLNVLGVWLVETYRNQFAQEVNARGIDGLIKALAERNRQFAAQSGKS